LATGSTPVGTYENLIERYKAGTLDFSGVKTVNLDEYDGLSPDHEQSYRYFMQKNLFDHVNIKPENTHVPNGLAADSAAECARYDAAIENLGGTCLQLLGIGRNGHIAFNEPSDHFAMGTHRTSLDASTIDANKRFFENESDVPRFAYTMGIRGIFRAKKILLVVSGADKAEALKKSFHGPVTPKVQASILQLHPNVFVVTDKAAAEGLEI